MKEKWTFERWYDFSWGSLLSFGVNTFVARGKYIFISLVLGPLTLAIEWSKHG